MLECKYRVLAPNSPCIHYIEPLNEGECGFCKEPFYFRCIESMKYRLPSFSSSAFTEWMQCKLKFYYPRIIGLRLKPAYVPRAIACGSIWDAFVGGETDLDILAASYAITDIERAKINALILATQELGIVWRPGETQCKIKFNILDNIVVGYLDKVLASGDGFEEHKLSSRPDYYSLLNIHQQCGTYLHANPEWEYVDMMVARLPLLETGKGTKANETVEEFQRRCYEDILTRPAFYFIGYDKKTHLYGKRFWRNEFDLDHIVKTYRWGMQELRDTIDRGSWYGNKFACEKPHMCQWMDICKTGALNDEVYEKVDPNNRDELSDR